MSARVPVVIPAYNPTAALAALVDVLTARGVELLIVVDDGSGPAFAPVFEQIAKQDSVQILRHAVNLGKGAALKSGLNCALAQAPDMIGVVTADADGQHDADDVVCIAGRLREHPDALILGVRQWNKHTRGRAEWGI